jgi:hypothetical protein
MPNTSARLSLVAERLAVLRQQRDELIRAHQGTLREIGQAAGLSPEAVRLIKLKEEK